MHHLSAGAIQLRCDGYKLPSSALSISRYIAKPMEKYELARSLMIILFHNIVKLTLLTAIQVVFVTPPPSC